MNRQAIWMMPLVVLAAACGAASDDKAEDTTDSAEASQEASKDASASAGNGDAKTKDDAAATPQVPANRASAPRMGKPKFDVKPASNDAASIVRIPENCRGFDFEGLVYSPGGDVLPNKCEPFNATTNNPYAVRCVDAWPWYKTQYGGDQFCILPPSPDKGIQYGVHPQGKEWFAQVSKGDMSGYENPSDDFTMQSGEEEERNYQTGTDNTETKNFYRNYARMRAGSHHMIVSTSNGGLKQEVWSGGSPEGLIGGQNMPGAQRPDENGPKSLDKPEEDSGLYSVLPAMTGITFDMHHFNATEAATLKEAWTNLWWEDDARVREYGLLGLNILQPVTLAIQPNTKQDLHYSWNVTQPVRIVTAFGHRHVWTTNFSSWIEEPDGKQNIIYQSFGWLDEPTYRYDSVTKNPEPAPEKLTDGAVSGLLMLQPGQKLHFNCHLDYTDERAKAEGAPSPVQIGQLRFANEAFTGEMCILFGSTAAVQLATPGADASALPDFAKTP